MRILLLFLTAFQLCAYDVVLPWCGRINGGDEADLFGYRMRFNGSWFQPADEISYAVPGPHSVDRLIIKVPCEPKETLVRYADVGFERVQGTWYVRGTPEHTSALRSEVPRYFPYRTTLPWSGKLVHGWREILFGRVLFFDADNMQFSTLPVEPDGSRGLVKVSEVRVVLPNEPTDTECEFRGKHFSKVFYQGGSRWDLVGTTRADNPAFFEVTLPWTENILTGHKVCAFGKSWVFDGERFEPTTRAWSSFSLTVAVSQVIFRSTAPIEGDRVEFAGWEFTKENGEWVDKYKREAALRDESELPPIPEKPFPGLRVVVGKNQYFLEDDLKTWLAVRGCTGRFPGHGYTVLEDKEKGVFVFARPNSDGILRTQADLYKPDNPYMRMATCPSYDVAVREAWRYILPPPVGAPRYNFTPVAKP